MKRNFFMSIPLVVLLLSGTAWGEIPGSPEGGAVARQAVSPSAVGDISAPADENVSEPRPAGYRYDPTGRRDPFASLIDIRKPLATSAVPLTPLQRFEIGQLRLLGVIIGKGEPRAMVVAPDGKSYVLKKGVKVGKHDGTVIDINQDAILIEERYVDFSGEVRTGTQQIALPKRQGVE